MLASDRTRCGCRSARVPQRKLSHALSSGVQRRNSDYHNSSVPQHKHGDAKPGPATLLDACGGLMAALWRWVGDYVALRHVLLAVALLAILYLQVRPALLGVALPLYGQKLCSRQAPRWWAVLRG